MEIEKIIGVERLRFVVQDSWDRIWSCKIVEQGTLEMQSNTRLKGLFNSNPGNSSKIL